LRQWPAGQDVQLKLAARARLLAAEAANKNDPSDARPVVVTVLRSRMQREAAADDHSTMLKAWSKHHHDLGRNRTQIACRLHAALCELIPGISKKITARLTQPPKRLPRSTDRRPHRQAGAEAGTRSRRRTCPRN
jgi:Transposase